MSGSYPPITLDSLSGLAPSTASTPGGFWNPLRQFAVSAVRSGTSELVGLPGEWAADLFGTSVEENDAWRNRNWWTSLGSQIVGAVPAYVASAAVTGPLAAATGISRAVPAVGRLFEPASRAAMMAAAPVRTMALEGLVTTVPISAARLGITPVLGGDLERVAASVGLDLAGSALMGGGFGLLSGLRASNALETEQLLARQIPDYNVSAPPQERLQALEGFTAATPELATLRDRTIEALRQTVRTESAPSLAGKRPWIAGLEGMEEAGERATRAMQLDLNRLFRPTPATTEDGAERALRVQTLSRSSSGFETESAWRQIVADAGLPNDWERNIQFPRVVTALGDEIARVQANLNRYLEDVGDGWWLRREANQDLFIFAKEVPTDKGRRWLVGRTNAPERLRPMLPALRRGDKLARFVGQAEENLLERAAKALPEDYILRMGVESQKNRPPSLRQNLSTWSITDHLPQPLANAAKELAPLKNEVWRKFKSVAAPTQHRFKDRPLISYVLQNAKHLYETAQGKAARALHGRRPGTSPINQLMRGLPDEGGLRSLFDKMTDEDVRIFAQYSAVREAGGLSLDEALNAIAPSVDAAALQRVEPVIRKWDEIANAAWAELKTTAELTGTKLGREVEGWALPHMWVGDWRQRVLNDDHTTTIFGGRTRQEAERAAKAYVKENGGSLKGNAFQTDREGDYELLLETRARSVVPSTAGISDMPNLRTRRRKPTGGFVTSSEAAMPTKAELWDIMSSDINMKYRSIAERAIQRLTQGLLPEIRGRYGRESLNEAVRMLRVMRGEQGELSKWQNKVVDSVLSPLLGKNSASKIAAAVNATEAHFAFGFGNLGFAAGNAVTFLQTVAPKLALMRQMGQRLPENAWQYFDFMPSFNAGGMPDGAFASINALKLGKAAMRSLVNPTPQERAAFERAVEEGVIAARIKDEYLGTKSRTMQAFRSMAQGEEPVTNLIRGLSNINMALPHRVEEITRAHAFFTWHHVAQLMNMTDEAAYVFAKRGTWASMYGYAQADRPRMFTGPVGMMAGLMKNWMFNYVGDMAQYAGAATRGDRHALLWMLGSTAVVGGLGGLPLVSAVDQFQRIFNDKRMSEELYSAVGVEAGDALWYGVPGLFGVSLQGMMGAPFNDPTRDISFLFNAVSLQRAMKVAQVGGDIWNRWAAGGENPFTQDRTWDQLAYALAPRTLYRMMAQIEDGALKSIRNGRAVIEGVSEAERALNAIGLTTTRVARAWDVSESLWDDADRRRALTREYAQAYSDAMTAGDVKAMQNVIARAIESGSDLSSVMRGALARQRELLRPQMPMDYLRVPGAFERMRTMGLVE